MTRLPYSILVVQSPIPLLTTLPGHNPTLTHIEYLMYVVYFSVSIPLGAHLCAKSSGGLVLFPVYPGHSGATSLGTAKICPKPALSLLPYKANHAPHPHLLAGYNVDSHDCAIAATNASICLPRTFLPFVWL